MSSSWTVHEIRTLGVGSFGRVKYGKYKGDGNMYAVKFMKKHEIIKLKQVDHINAERNLMQQINHPFAVNMFGSFKDDRSALGSCSSMPLKLSTSPNDEIRQHLRQKRRAIVQQMFQSCVRNFATMTTSTFEKKAN